MKNKQDQSLREHLVEVLQGGSAHVKFEGAIKGLSGKRVGLRPASLPHSVWMLLEHMRIAQRDILEFSRNAKHVSPKWPEGYWPGTEAPPNAAAWSKSVRQFRRDLTAMQRLVADKQADLFAKIPWGDGQTILREALLVADHNSYHLAQIVDVRKALGNWD